MLLWTFDQNFNCLAVPYPLIRSTPCGNGIESKSCGSSPATVSSALLLELVSHSRIHLREPVDSVNPNKIVVDACSMPVEAEKCWAGRLLMK